MSQREQVRQAQQKIAWILRDLELQTGELVESLDVHDHEVTTISDPDVQLVRQVSIRMRRLPGHRWAP